MGKTIIGISGLKPIHVIILAQAVNGFVLPFVAVFLLLVVNDKELMPVNYRNSDWLNLVTVNSFQTTWILAGVSFVITGNSRYSGFKWSEMIMMGH